MCRQEALKLPELKEFSTRYVKTVPRFGSKAEWQQRSLSLGVRPPHAHAVLPPRKAPRKKTPREPPREHTHSLAVLAQISALDAALLQKAGGKLGQRPSFHLEVCARNWIVMGDLLDTHEFCLRE